MDFTTLKYYDELTPEAQAQARMNILVPVKINLASLKAEAKYSVSVARLNRLRAAKGHPVQGVTINSLVNDPYHISQFFYSENVLRKVERLGDAYLLPYIRENRCIFTPCGAYVVYTGIFELIHDGKIYIPTPEEQKALREPYIVVNERGPAFHDWLYRMHHKIKFYMIRG